MWETSHCGLATLDLLRGLAARHPRFIAMLERDERLSRLDVAGLGPAWSKIAHAIPLPSSRPRLESVAVGLLELAQRDGADGADGAKPMCGGGATARGDATTGPALERVKKRPKVTTMGSRSAAQNLAAVERQQIATAAAAASGKRDRKQTQLFDPELAVAEWHAVPNVVAEPGQGGRLASSLGRGRVGGGGEGAARSGRGKGRTKRGRGRGRAQVSSVSQSRPVIGKNAFENSILALSAGYRQPYDFSTPLAPSEDTDKEDKGESEEESNQNWVQCDRCSKWRIVDTTPDQQASYFCEMQPGVYCSTPEEESWLSQKCFNGKVKSPTLEKCLACLEEFAYRVPDCGYSHQGKGGKRIDVQASMVETIRQCKRVSGELAVKDVANVMRRVVSQIRKLFLRREEDQDWKLSEWLHNLDSAASAKDLYEAGLEVEECGIDWDRLQAVNEFLKILGDVSDNWLAAPAVNFVRKGLVDKVLAAQCGGGGEVLGSNGLLSLTSQLCDVLMGRDPEPVGKVDAPDSASTCHEVKVEKASDGSTHLAPVQQAPSCLVIDDDGFLDDDDGGCQVMCIEEMHARARLHDRAKKIQDDVHKLWRDAKSKRHVTTMKCRSLLRHLQHALHLRSGALPESKILHGWSSGAKVEPPDSDEDRFGDIEEIGVEEVSGAASPAVSTAEYVDVNACQGRAAVAHSDPAFTAVSGAHQASEGRMRDRFGAEEGAGAESFETSCSRALSPTMSESRSRPELSEEQLRECASKCIEEERSLLRQCQNISAWLDQLVGKVDCGMDGEQSSARSVPNTGEFSRALVSLINATLDGRVPLDAEANKAWRACADEATTLQR